MGTLRRLRTGLFGAAVACALGLGATQALAGPAEAAPPARQCDPALCAQICKALFGPFTGGYCDAEGNCRCAF